MLIKDIICDESSIGEASALSASKPVKYDMMNGMVDTNELCLQHCLGYD